MDLGSSGSSRSRVIPLPQREDGLEMALKDATLEEDLSNQHPWRGVSVLPGITERGECFSWLLHDSHPLSFGARAKRSGQGASPGSASKAPAAARVGCSGSISHLRDGEIALTLIKPRD